ncbi:hypothetical protein AMELA_G00257170 [Ameiurus melas]|uniref:Uncharacterized protein n=1 Tax=Ameiurus melas TaxID=219545 RepID=A0A7J5ZVP7_AMEME|nr:hypothetical protein AMELA_G00257170 [Ameiurus melas]
MATAAQNGNDQTMVETTFGYDVVIERILEEFIPDLQKVQNVEESEFILVFCPVVSRAGTDIEAAVENLNTLAGNKPAVLVVLHHTSDPESVVPDSSRAVKRNNTITVDCLFHEDQGVLQCSENDKALSQIINWINPEAISERTPSKSPNQDYTVDQMLKIALLKYFPLVVENTLEHDGILNKTTRKRPTHFHTANQMLKHPVLNHFTLITGDTFGHDVRIERRLREVIPGLQKVQKVEESDFILFFCPIVSQAGTDIEAAVMKLNTLPGNKPAVLVVLHRTSDPESVVPDFSRAVKRENTITVDCLFHEDQGVLQCSENDKALSQVINWCYTAETVNKPLSKHPTQGHTAKKTLKHPVLKHFTLITGKTLGHDVDIERRLRELIPDLQKVQNVEESDLILVFCTIVSRAGTDLEAAVMELNTRAGDKPAVLVVLHHTFDPESVVPDSSRAVKRENTITVDCLFHEDQGLLQCRRNNEGFNSISEWIKTRVDKKTETNEHIDRFKRMFSSRMDRFKRNTQDHTANQMLKQLVLKHFTLITGKTLGHDVRIERRLLEVIPDLQKVENVEESDFILVLCPIVSQAGTDLEAVVENLNSLPGNKPAFLLVIHHMSDPESVVPDLSRAITREKTITVDCLLHEDQGLLDCSQNDKALSQVINWCYTEPILERTPSKSPNQDYTVDQMLKIALLKYFPLVVENTLEHDGILNKTTRKRPNQDHTTKEMLKHPVLKHFTLITGKTLGQDVDIERRLQKLIPGLQKVQKVEESGFILVICPVVSQAGTDIEAAVMKLNTLPGNKPAVLVVLHHTFDPECVVPDSSRAVKRENTITVDCLFHEDQGLLKCRRNNEGFNSISEWINTRVDKKTETNEHIDRFKRTFSSGMDRFKRNTQVHPDLKHFTLITGDTLGHDVDIERRLQELIPGLQKVQNVEESDLILVFCPIVSRAGTDLEAAVMKLNTRAGDKPAVLVVLHHTFDPESVVPDSSRAVKRENTITVDCLFHEDQGLLQCRRNSEGFKSISKWIKTRVDKKTETNEHIDRFKRMFSNEKTPTKLDKREQMNDESREGLADPEEPLTNPLLHT